jgi:hypothetical protein
MPAQPVLDRSPVRLVKVPGAAPRFDCEVVPGATAAVPPPGWDSLELPALPQWPVAGTGPSPESVRKPEAAPEPDGWTGQFARLLTETMTGARPMRQLQPWLTGNARVHLIKATPALTCGQRPRVLRVLASWPADSVAELSIIVGLGPRTKALAVRLEKTAPKPGQPPRWLCTDIEAA